MFSKKRTNLQISVSSSVKRVLYIAHGSMKKETAAPLLASSFIKNIDVQYIQYSQFANRLYCLVHLFRRFNPPPLWWVQVSIKRWSSWAPNPVSSSVYSTDRYKKKNLWACQSFENQIILQIVFLFCSLYLCEQQRQRLRFAREFVFYSVHLCFIQVFNDNFESKSVFQFRISINAG